ncbi:MAG: TIGR01244 family phosphatase [Proteobacteria bacterium]|nr:TIGR01244 family phosphatase [Pseudomonadota bacterium]
MDIRRLTDSYAVSPQILPEDVAAIAAAGFTTIVNNRPDGEIPPEVQTEAIRAAVEAAGLAYVVNPVIGGAITMDNIRLQGAAVADATGPVFAYCASGNRSSIVWALSQAGTRPTNELIGAAARFGYNLEPMRAQIDALSVNRG